MSSLLNVFAMLWLFCLAEIYLVECYPPFEQKGPGILPLNLCRLCIPSCS